MNTRSIRFRLTAWHAGLLGAVFALLGLLLLVQLRSALENTILDAQSRRAGQIAATLLAGGPGQSGGRDIGATIESLYAPEQSGRFIRVTRQGGAIVYVSGPPTDSGFDPAAVPPLDPWPQRQSVRRERAGEGDPLLIAAWRTVPADGQARLVEVGTSAAPVDATIDRLSLLLYIGIPLLVLIAAGGGYILVRRSLKPVEEMAGKAEAITQHNLDQRLPVFRTGDELERLSAALNRMITRLDEAFLNSKRFVADASHELRTPLTILRGELENLTQDPGTPEAIRDRIGSMLEEVERLARIVDQLLALSRLDAGEAQAQVVRFDLGAVVSGVADQMMLLAEDRRITVECDAKAGVQVVGDRTRIQQVVVNLLDNAIKYTPEGGAVRLKVAAEGPNALLEVSDTGAGIPSEAVPHVFERFYRADQSRASRPEGAGLGLAIVKSICTAHAGEVEAESAPGRGSRFRVRLPLAV